MTTRPTSGTHSDLDGERGRRDAANIVVRLDRWLLSNAPAQRLAALRIMVGGFVVVYMAGTVNEFTRASRLPVDDFEPVGIATLLREPLSPGQIFAFIVVAIVSGLAFTAGVGFRFSGPAFAITALAWASYHSSWGQMLHFEHIFTLHVLVLAFAPAADAWSVKFRPGSIRRIHWSSACSGRAASDHVRYGWPIKLLAIVTAVTYVVSAVTKLRTSGLAWVDADTLSNHIAYSTTRLDLLGARRPPLAVFALSNRWLLGPMAWAALLIELFAPIALLGGRWRRWWVVAAVLMHTGAALTMLVWFPFHGLGFAMLPLFRCEKLLTRVLGHRRR